MTGQLENFLKAFIPLFVAIDPIGLAAVFLAMGAGVPVERRKKIATQATWTGPCNSSARGQCIRRDGGPAPRRISLLRSP